MSSRCAPRAATWLLERFCSASRFDPLIGDLVEQFEEGRSRLWYWRQATGALASHVFRALRTDAPTFIVAILAGSVLDSFWKIGCWRAFHAVYANLADVTPHPWSREALLRLAGMQAHTGSDIALYCISAWLVTRIHRAHQRAVLAAFAIAVIARSLPDIAQPFNGMQTWTVATHIVLIALQVACTLVAGLWMIRRKRHIETDHRTRFVTIFWITQMLATALFFAACGVGEMSYPRPAGILSMYAACVVCGLYLALRLWHQNSTSSAARRLA